MFHLCAYTNSPAGVVTLANAVPVPDGSIAINANAFRFTEQYRLLAAYAHAALITQAEIRSPTLNGLSLWNIWPLATSLNNPANPNVDDYRPFAPLIPTYEDITVLYSDTAAAGERADVLLWIGTPGWTSDLGALVSMYTSGDPYVGRRMTLNSTTTVNKGAGAWGADTALTFEQLPRGGVYAVLGGQVVAAGCAAWRINFPRMPLYQGRKLFPGDLVSQAVGDQPHFRWRNWLGIWGVFHTWELPFVSLYGQAAGTVAWNANLDVVYLGGNQDPKGAFQNALAVLANAA